MEYPLTLTVLRNDLQKWLSNQPFYIFRVQNIQLNENQ